MTTKLKAPRLRFLGNVTGLPIYLVSGELVRNTIDLDFTAGGNEGVYPTYVPPGEIWIDDALHAFDRVATSLHEIVERDLMIHHGWSYDRAHDAALEIERSFRKGLLRNRPKAFDAKLVERAFVAWQKDRSKGTYPNKHEKQLGREVDMILTKRVR
jgi:hypothetical protein